MKALQTGQQRQQQQQQRPKSPSLESLPDTTVPILQANHPVTFTGVGPVYPPVESDRELIPIENMTAEDVSNWTKAPSSSLYDLKIFARSVIFHGKLS